MRNILVWLGALIVVGCGSSTAEHIGQTKQADICTMSAEQQPDGGWEYHSSCHYNYVAPPEEAAKPVENICQNAIALCDSDNDCPPAHSGYIAWCAPICGQKGPDGAFHAACIYLEVSK